MRRLYLILPLSALLIAGLIVYRLNRTSAPIAARDTRETARAAYLFQLYNEESELVRLARYLGRHKILIVFFDGKKGPDGSELLQTLKRNFAPIQKTGAIVLAISDLRPSQLRPPPNDRGERV